MKPLHAMSVLTFDSPGSKFRSRCYTVTMKTSETVSQVYTHCQLTYYCVCHLEIASQLLFQQSFQFPSISGSHVFPIMHGHDTITKSHDVIFFNEISMRFQ